VADITFVPTASGFLYLAVVLDAWSRKVVGWSMANHLRTELVLDALEMAIGQRRPDGVIHHSDQGERYSRGVVSEKGLTVRRLAAGGRRIRTHGPTPNGTEMGGRRRPVVLAPEAWPAWLGEEPADEAHLKSLLAPPTLPTA
jgi:transposase InsO family protein